VRRALTRLAGTGIAATAALAVLVFGCVFVATAAPREALASRTLALRQALGGSLPAARSIVVSSSWSGISSSLVNGRRNGPFGIGTGSPAANLKVGQLAEITGQLHDDLDRGVVHLAPPAQDWSGALAKPHTVTSKLPAVGGYEVRLEVSYRQPFTGHLRLVAGRYPGIPAGTQTLEVVVSQRTATTFGLHPGSTMRVTGPDFALNGNLAPITLDVTGIVVPLDPASTFWTADPTLLAPDLTCDNCYPTSIWIGEVLAGPGEFGAVQRDFGPEGLNFQWELPMAAGSLDGAQAQELHDALTRLDGQLPPMRGDVAHVSDVLQVAAPLLEPLGVFISTAQEVDALLWLLYVSLAVAGLVTLLLAARMVAMRRSAELSLRRARGASLAQLAAVTARGAAIACLPAAAAAVVLAVLVVPGPAPSGGWWPPAAVLAAGVAAPAVAAAWQQRLPRRRARDRRRARGWARLAAQVTACLAAVAGVIVFRQHGSTAGAGVNLYTSAAPALIAIPAVIVVARIYPLTLRALLRGSARGTGAATFLGLARAARTALTPALPAFALVLALTVAAFAGMIRDAVTRGEVAASWQTAGADVSIAATRQNTFGATITPAEVRALAAVPGISRAATAWQSVWATANGGQLTAIVVDPASYAALVADTQTFPRIPAGLLAAGSPQQVLASPQAAAELGAGVTAISSQAAVQPVRVRVAGVLSGTPALPGGGTFVIIPATVIRSTATPPGPVPVNELLLTGAHIDQAKLAAVLREQVPGAVATVRSDILKGLTGAPLQHGAFVLFELAVAAAVALGLAVMLLELALGAAERAAALGRLAAMGLGERQRARVVTLEVLPAVAAAAVAAGASALILPRVVAPAIDLSVFTGPAAGSPAVGSPAVGSPALGGVALAPDAASFLLPLAGLAVAAIAMLVMQVRAGRRGVTATLRAGS
jgi:putative ABC transport system permease protein